MDVISNTAWACRGVTGSLLELHARFIQYHLVNVDTSVGRLTINNKLISMIVRIQKPVIFACHTRLGAVEFKGS